MDMAVSGEDYRRIMGNFATGVTIVTTACDGQLGGMTANAITSVSLDPMLLLFCADNRSRTHGMVDRSGIFAVNILTQEMRNWSNIFADSKRAEEQRFENLKHTTATTGAPILEGNLGWIDCRVAHRYAGGDHTIFVGEVVDAAWAEGKPLIFYQGRYRELRD